MVHLSPLPGAPRYQSDLGMDAVIARALNDATKLAEAGFPALMIENYGDSPFFAARVPPVTVAALTRVVARVRDETGLAVGVNVLRNDAISALGIAAATGAGWIRVNVLSGLMYTDQGPIVGQAAEVARLRKDWCPEVGILADVFVKHATPPPGSEISVAGADTWERAGADGLVVSGTATGSAPDLDSARDLRVAVPDAPILVGSGATAANLAELAKVANGVIVGSSLKVGGRAEGEVDLNSARDFVAAAREVGWLEP
ncbi:MAG TPA: BtpA/SgcQ family protein [Acidimicrobiia bacterium]|nr:BtpA/SgcQ family protein [Acidimicrobiia bacterium]